MWDGNFIFLSCSDRFCVAPLLTLFALGAHLGTKHAARAETESALVIRLSKFLSGCDSFYEEPPLAVAMQFTLEAGTKGAATQATQERTGMAAGRFPPGMNDDPNGTVPLPSAGATERFTGRKRRFPTGGLENGDRRICDGNAEGDVGGVGDPAEVEQQSLATARRRGRSSSGPAGQSRLDGEDDEVTRQGEAPKERASVAAATGEMMKGEPSESHAEENNDDGFTAPSFLTPPLTSIATGGAAAGPGAGSVAGATPSSACSSAGSTPSNGSSSPALAVVSPGPSTTLRPSRGEGRNRDAAVVVDGGRKQARGGSISDVIGGAGGVLAPLPEERPYSCSSPTPPSTKEPSTPPLSTQEGSQSAAEGDNERDMVQDDVDDNDNVDDDHGNKGQEQACATGGETEEDEEDGFSVAGRAAGVVSGLADFESRRDGIDATGRAAAGHALAPARRRYISDGGAGFLLRAPGGLARGEEEDDAETSLADPAEQTRDRKRRRVKCAEEQVQHGRGSEQEDGGYEQDEEEEGDEGMLDTADTVEDVVAAVPTAAPAHAAPADPATRRSDTNATKRVRTLGDDGNTRLAAADADGSRRYEDKELLQQARHEAAASCLGSQAGVCADEAGGAETETETGSGVLCGARTGRGILEDAPR